jgi:hypothetical protein
MGFLLPLKDICKNLCLFHGVFQGVVSVSALRPKGGKQLGLASFCDWNASLHREGCLDIEAKRVIEWRTVRRKRMKYQ